MRASQHDNNDTGVTIRNCILEVFHIGCGKVSRLEKHDKLTLSSPTLFLQADETRGEDGGREYKSEHITG